MATSIESSSPSPLHKGPSTLMGTSPTFSPSSEKHFWSTLNNRVDKILENKKSSLQNQVNNGASDRAKRIKEDSMLLLRGFDSVSHSLSQLSNNLENALQVSFPCSCFS
ncbi:hypothetical protein Leryth_021465 [Lithospermum erythrorhizon]|nr:hypothetical protein Leryth_021465 [Lithospermum erythrorhizon]